MIPGQLAVRAQSFNGMGLDLFEDAQLERRTGDVITKRDGPLLVIANLPNQNPDLSSRPVLVLTPKGQLGWVVDFMLEEYGESW